MDTMKNFFIYICTTMRQNAMVNRWWWHGDILFRVASVA